MANPLLRAIKSGVRANASIGRLFARLGTGDHSRGVIPTVYRNGRRELEAGLREQNEARILGSLAAMRLELQAGLQPVMLDAVNLGNEEADRQLGFYGLEAAAAIALSTQPYGAVDAVLARYDSQASTIRGLAATGADPFLILGDDGRAGVLRPSDVLIAAAFWVSSLTWLAWANAIEQSLTRPEAAPGAAGSRLEFQKQVIAALDERTTNCCLQAHGQIQPLTEKFRLTGTPRYADQLEWTPFHYYCRSAIVLYDESFDDGLTARMRSGAQQVLNERARGEFIVRHPADAFID